MTRKRIKPVHPGAYLREVLEELSVSQYRLAQDIGVAPMRISHVVRGQRPVTAELALRLGRYLRQSPRFWLNLQSRYDMDVTQDELGKLVEREVRPLKAVA
jgi:addiction module HigA family antidote